MDIYGQIDARLLDVDRALAKYGKAKDRTNLLLVLGGILCGALLAFTAVALTFLVFSLERI